MSTAAEGLIGDRRTQVTKPRPIIIHYHLFKNAGTSLDRTLRQNFGVTWATIEHEPTMRPAELRRFLVESRIQEALEPILDQLQEDVPPSVDKARTAMREVSQVLQKAFQAARRALPPGETVVNEGPARRKRKR